MNQDETKPLEVKLKDSNNNDNSNDNLNEKKIKTALTSNCLSKYIKIPKIEWTWIVGVRIFIIIATAVGMFFNSTYGLAMPATEIECVLDKTFNLTSFINTFFSTHLYVKRAFIIISSLFTDLMILIALGYWVFYTKSLRFLMSLCLFYIVHSFIRLFFFIDTPQTYLWEHPNFPSLFVTYVKTTSFFFTNCIGLLMICLMEWRKNRNTIMAIVTLVCIIFECIIMHSLRAHYVIDLFSGIFIGHYIFIIVEVFVDYIDKTLPFPSGEASLEKEKVVQNSTSMNGLI